MRRALIAVALCALVAGACSSEDDAGGTTDATVAATEAPADDPPETDPPATDPPATDPPATDPPATDPPATDPPATDPPADPADLAVTEVVFDDRLTITNLGTEPIDLDGVWICNRPSYAPLPAQMLAPGESIDFTDLPLPAGGGEAALYNGNSFADSSTIVDYVSWGAGGGRASVATDAGLWPANDAVQTTAASIAAPNGGSSSADWS